MDGNAKAEPTDNVVLDDDGEDGSVKKQRRGRGDLRTKKLEKFVLEDTRHDEDTYGRNAREVQRRNEVNEVDKSSAKDGN